MSEEQRLRRGRTAATKSRDRVPLAEQHAVEIASDLTPLPSSRRSLELANKLTAITPGADGGRAIEPAPKFHLAWTNFASLPDALRLIKVPPVLASFIVVVLVPAFAATIYFALIASNQPTAEARFAVRQVESDSTDNSANTADAATAGTAATGSSVNFSFTATGQSAYIVTSYINSRAIVDDLSNKLNLREVFRRPEADFWARLKRNASIDDLTDYWKSMVNTYIDAPSGIVTLQVRAFRADDAVALAKAVLDLSETLVNRISDRARRDATESSEQEVRRTYELTRAALTDLHQFRDSSGMIDPVQAGTEIGKLLLPLLTEKIHLESDLFIASRDLDETAPTIKALKSRLDTTEQQISDLRGKLTNTGGDGKTLTASLAKFEELDLKRQFAEKLYTLAQADFDRARLRAARQSVYLTVFVPPSLPEESRYPRRVAFPILIFLGLTIVWAIGAMILASVEDHRL